MSLRNHLATRINLTTLALSLLLLLPAQISMAQDGDGSACIDCHRTTAPALVMEWERSSHASNDVGCIDCHAAQEGDVDGWLHQGQWVSAIVTPKDCSNCHDKEYTEFAGSHHAKAGEILASLDNVLAEKVAGLPHNKADAVSGCWQCHGSIIRFEEDENGEILKTGPENKPVIHPDTWPNTGMGRLNPDGSKGSCHACHSRHSFDTKLARSPENCGKCHMGPDHPQIEIYNESKHGIAFYANRDLMNLDKKGEWVLGRDYSAAPTCATCHTSSYMTPNGLHTTNSHDVGDRISWTLRPIVSVKLNRVEYDDGFKEDYPEDRALPNPGDRVETTEKVVVDYELVSQKVTRTVASITTWQQRRENMKGACRNCHSDTHIDNFYTQFDNLVDLYNDKFAIPAKKFMDDLKADGVLNPNAPFEHKVQWVFWELWHHEGRRARHGASMMGPDYTHWHGMYEVSKHYYTEFLPEVIEAAATKGEAMAEKYRLRVEELLTREEHTWMKGLSPEEAEALRKAYQDRYDQ
jgi:hydroxylamine dehydrogenase